MTLAIELILYLIATMLGLFFFIYRKSPLYFKLLFFAVACCLLEELYNFVYSICIGGAALTFSFATFASGAAFAFLYSANFGQFDSFVDDGSLEFKNARAIGFAAPIALAAVFVLTIIKSNYSIWHIALLLICKLWAFFACYYHLKHLILPDKIHFMVDALRPCNLICLVYIFMNFLCDFARATSADAATKILSLAMPLCLIAMIIAAEGGLRKWKI